jgi:hypothetical protein
MSYVENNFKTPVGLVGCRAADERFSFDCCEFDLAVFSENNHSDNSLLKIGKYFVEVITIPINSRRNLIALKDMSLAKCYTSTFPLTTSQMHIIFNNKISNPDSKRAFLSAGKRKILESLFHFDRIDRAFKFNPVVASMWLKLSAYDFLEGVVILSGQRPMPLHELQQVRIINFDDESVSNGIRIALSCIGIERANRSTISRSSCTLENLLSNEYDKDLVLGKLRSLEKVGMLPDCYYYIGKMVKRQLVNKDDKYYNTYSKLVQIALDLSIDIQQNLRLHRQLIDTAKNILKCYRKISVA